MGRRQRPHSHHEPVTVTPNLTTAILTPHTDILTHMAAAITGIRMGSHTDMPMHRHTPAIATHRTRTQLRPDPPVMYQPSNTIMLPLITHMDMDMDMARIPVNY